MSQAGILVSGSSGGGVSSLTGDTGGAVSPLAGNINIIGADGLTVVGNPATYTLTITPGTIGTVTTTNATPTTVLTIPLGATPGVYTFDAQIGGYDVTDTEAVGYTLVGAVRTTGAAAVLIAGQALDEFEETTPVDLTACTAVLNVTGNSAIFQVTGLAGKTIHWKASTQYIFAS